MPSVTDHDLAQLGEICGKICYHLTAHIKAVADGVPGAGTSDVAKVYQLAAALPAPTEAQWAALAGHAPARAAKPAAAAAGTPAALAEGAERAPGKRLKWTQQLEAELVQLVEDEEFRKEKLGKDAQRGGALNWAGVARHFGYNNGAAVKNKYNELKGIPRESGGKKKKAEGEAQDGEKPEAKKPKKEEGKPAAAAAAAAPAPAAGATPAAGDWSKKQGQELVKLVEDEEERKKALGKRRLRWKSIAKHFDKHKKDCRKQYTKLTGKEAPEDDE
ncbi:hypothetical protein ABPG75_011146 [Micractinium tetrahymenae]